jgi:hypothetical protein
VGKAACRKATAKPVAAIEAKKVEVTSKAIDCYIVTVQPKSSELGIGVSWP